MINYTKNEPAPDKAPWFSCWDGPRMIGNICDNGNTEWHFYPVEWMSLHSWSASMMLDLGHKLESLNTKVHD